MSDNKTVPSAEEYRKIVAAQQYALDKCQDDMSCLTKVKLAWENGFETAIETRHEHTRLHLEAMRYEVKRRQQIILSEPNGVVRETMINNLTINL